MSEGQKKGLVIAVAVIAVAAAAYSVFTFTSGPKEEVVGTIDMGAGGGRDAEKTSGGGGGGAVGSQGADPSGMPPEMAGGGR